MAEPLEAKRSEELLNKYKGHVWLLEHSLNAAQPFLQRQISTQPTLSPFILSL